MVKGKQGDNSLFDYSKGKNPRNLMAEKMGGKPRNCR